MTTPALALAGIRKGFGPVQALDGADLLVHPGTLHALLGENGAGKSTLLGVVGGLLRPEAGTMQRNGAEYRPRDPRAARAAGIGMVHQHFTSIAALTVWENIALAAGWPIDGARARAIAALAARGVSLEPDALVEELSVGRRQQLELQKALAAEPRLLLLDEPTGVLTPPEIADLFRVIREFTTSGGAVVLITHKLDEALEHADRITVLRRGRVTYSSRPDAPPDRTTLLQAMLGDRAAEARPHRPAPPLGKVVATAGGLELRAGEVVGVAGVEGNGQRELFHRIALGASATGLIPEDRTTEGLIAEFTVAENVELASPGAPRGDARERAARLIAEYGVKASGPDALISTLSGGNQQKVVVGRALLDGPPLLVAENPARGLDVTAAVEVFERLRLAAADGTAVLFYSTDLDEVLTWADRVLVMVGGELRVPPPGADRARIGEMMVAR